MSSHSTDRWREKAREHIRQMMADAKTRPPQALAESKEFRAAMRSWGIDESDGRYQRPSAEPPDAEEA